jgi:hypothetical protein
MSGLGEVSWMMRVDSRDLLRLSLAFLLFGDWAAQGVYGGRHSYTPL